MIVNGKMVVNAMYRDTTTINTPLLTTINGMVFEVQHTSTQRCIPWSSARLRHWAMESPGMPWQMLSIAFWVFGAELVHLETWGFYINSIEFILRKIQKLGKYM